MHWCSPGGDQQCARHSLRWRVSPARDTVAVLLRLLRAARRELILFRGRMISLHHQGLAVALVSFVVLSGCGGSGRARNTGAGAGTSIAAALIAFVAPRDGADAVIGGQLGSFAQTVQSKRSITA